MLLLKQCSYCFIFANLINETFSLSLSLSLFSFTIGELEYFFMFQQYMWVACLVNCSYPLPIFFTLDQ